MSEHLASPQPVLPKGSDVANISKNNLSFLVWFGSGLTRWLTPMVLTEMGNGAATGTVIPHEGTPTSSARVGESRNWKRVASAPG